MKNTYKIYPDHASTGVWLVYKDVDGSDLRHVNVDIPEYVPQILTIALKYWHNIWEFFIDDSFDNGRASGWYSDKWSMDGQLLVDELNKLGIDEYIYII
jgi:hypothetical protein